VQLAQLVVQPHSFLSEVQSERHNNTNNPETGVGNSNLKCILLNLVGDGELEFPQSLRTPLQVDPLKQGPMEANPWIQTHGDSAKAQ
jgi:hypothetical protein